MNVIVYVVILAAALAAFTAWKRSRAGAIATMVLLLGTLGWIQYQKQEMQRLAILALAQEVSPAQYLTLAAIAQKTPEGRAAVRRAIADGHVVWKEYSPIEQQAASVISYGAREDAMRATGIDPKAAAERDRQRMDRSIDPLAHATGSTR